LPPTPATAPVHWQALASSMPNLQELQLWGEVQSAVDWRTILPCFSRLHSLSLPFGAFSAPPAFYAALQYVPGLRSLTAMSCFNYPALAALTQLQDLTLPVPSMIYLKPNEVAAHPSIQGPGIAVLGRLTGLTALQLSAPGEFGPPFKWQEQLSSALTALSKLQHLQLPRVLAGPVAAALGQMTSLTHLSLTASQQTLDKGLHLPGVQVLRLFRVDMGFLNTLHAPKLQALQGGSGVGSVALNLGVGVGLGQQVALLEQCARGVLSRCNRLALECTCKTPLGDLAAAALQALGRCWRPDPSLVNGSAPHVQIPAPSTKVSRTGAAAAAAAAGGWYLKVPQLSCSREALVALPKGLTHLHLG
jgi:hypothetical protein